MKYSFGTGGIFALSLLGRIRTYNLPFGGALPLELLTKLNVHSVGNVHLRMCVNPTLLGDKCENSNLFSRKIK